MFNKLKNLFKSNNMSSENDFYEEEGNFDLDKTKILKNKRLKDSNLKAAEKTLEKEQQQEKQQQEKQRKFSIISIIIIGFLLVLLVIVLILRATFFKDGTLNSITVNVPEIIYLDEKSEISVTANGKGNLRQTEYLFETTNSSIVELDKKSHIKGKKVTNKLMPISTGKFALTINAELDNRQLDTFEKQIVICKRLTNDSLTTESINLEVNKTSLINIDIGNDAECYKNITYTISDNSVAKIDEQGNITALKEGMATITMVNDSTVVTEKITISSDIVKPTELNLDVEALTLTIGDEKTIKATLAPDNTTNKNLIWTTSNEGVATVSSKGVVKGLGKGTATIEVSTEDKSLVKKLVVTVNEKEITTPSDKTAPKLLKVRIYSSATTKTQAEIGDTIYVEITANEKLSVKPTVTIAGTSVSVSSSNPSANNPVYKGSFKVKNTTKSGNAAIVITGYKDFAKNVGSKVTSTTDGSKVYITIDTTVPSIQSITRPSDKYYKSGEKLTFTIIYNENVTGTLPKLNIKIGDKAKSITGSRSGKVLTYSYTILSGDNGALSIVSLSGGTLQDNNGNSAKLIFTVPNTSKVIADTTIPTITYTGNSAKPALTATFKDNVGVVGYKLTNSSAVPTSFDSITSTKESTKELTMTGVGTYYMHIKDVAGNTAYKQVEISTVAGGTVTTHRTRSYTAVGGRYTNNYCPASTYSWFQDKSNIGTICYWMAWKRTCTAGGAYCNTVELYTSLKIENCEVKNGLKVWCSTSVGGSSGGYYAATKYVAGSWVNRSEYTTCSGAGCCGATLSENGRVYMLNRSAPIYKCYNYTAWSGYTDGDCSSTTCVNGYGVCCEKGTRTGAITYKYE